MKEWSGRWTRTHAWTWQGPYYLYYDARTHQNFITTLLRRQDPVAPGDLHAITGRITPVACHNPHLTKHCSASLADLKHACCLDDRRLPLPFSKLGSLGAVGVNTSKFLPVFIKTVTCQCLCLRRLSLPSLVRFFFQCCYPRPYYLN